MSSTPTVEPVVEPTPPTELTEAERLAIYQQMFRMPYGGMVRMPSAENVTPESIARYLADLRGELTRQAAHHEHVEAEANTLRSQRAAIRDFPGDGDRMTAGPTTTTPARFVGELVQSGQMHGRFGEVRAFRANHRSGPRHSPQEIEVVATLGGALVSAWIDEARVYPATLTHVVDHYGELLRNEAQTIANLRARISELEEWND
jgi:hypothetical protein